jgi:allophanate hydrolase
MHPVTRQLIAASRDLTAADAFRSQHALMEAKRAATEAWGDIDVLVTPTTGTIYRIADVNADPIRLNANLGFYTNFVNFLDLAAVAIPAGFRNDGLPFGVTLVGPAWSEKQLLTLADRMHRNADDEPERPPANAGAQARADAQPIPPAHPDYKLLAVSSRDHVPERIPVAVCGAHLESLPLNHQLTTRGATLMSRTHTAPAYRFYALPGGPPFRPGLMRVASNGASIAVEVWSIPAEHFGSFVAGISSPLGIGKIELEDGTHVPGFICEPYGIEGAKDITSFGNWRDYLKSLPA